MNKHVQPSNPHAGTQFEWWWNACHGVRQPLSSNREPQSGYYRDGARGISVWRSERGIHHAVTDGPKFRSLDTLNDAFGRFCMRPISEDLYFAVSEGQPWPEETSGEIEAARGEAGIGHNSATPHEMVRDELAAIGAAYKAWLKDIGGKIETEEQNAKAEGFQKRALATEKEIKAKHEAEKAPYLAGCREIDARWISGPTSIKGQAEALKRAIGADRTPFLVEKDRKAQAEAKRVAEERERWRQEQARKQAEAAAVSQPVTPEVAPPPPPPPRKEATGLHSHYSVKVNDLPALVAQLATLSPPIEAALLHGAFVEAAEKVALKLLRMGVEVQGATLIQEKRA